MSLDGLTDPCLSIYLSITRLSILRLKLSFLFELWGGVPRPLNNKTLNSEIETYALFLPLSELGASQ